MKRVLLLLPVAAVLWCAVDDGNASLLPDGPGKDTVAKLCVECHSVDRMRTNRIGRDEWNDKINDMRDRGADISDADNKILLDYLTANFGTDSKIWINTAPSIELKAILSFNNAEASALLAYRLANGKVKDWDALLKISGLDAKKLEAKKDQIAF